MRIKSGLLNWKQNKMPSREKCWAQVCSIHAECTGRRTQIPWPETLNFDGKFGLFFDRSTTEYYGFVPRFVSEQNTLLYRGDPSTLTKS